jgi:secreted PhoX family phosphatase
MAYLAPVGAAIGGAAFDTATRTVFGMVRHPGATPGATFDTPATRWPTLLPNMPPQSTVIGLVQL